MSEKRITLGELAFQYEVTEVGDGTWIAVVTGVHSQSQDVSTQIGVRETGRSAKEAADRLESKVRSCFTLPEGELTVSFLLFAAYRWIWAGASFRQRCVRFSGTAFAALLISPFFFNFFSGDTTLSKNLQGISTHFQECVVSETGFFDERFFEMRLAESNRRFWASGVSFRNLRSGNRDDLAALLRKESGIEFKIVLLDPVSVLAQDSFMKKLSRSSRRSDIEETIRQLVEPSSGIVALLGDRQTDQVWVSDYAPIVPMVVVDDHVYVSFLTHVDRSRAQNAYQSPYLRCSTDSGLGMMLLKHFNSMVEASGAKLLYPN